MANQAVLFIILILLLLGYYVMEYGADGLKETVYKIINELSKIGGRINKI